MFEIRVSAKGERKLFFVERRRNGERGIWVQICHSEDKQASYYVALNKEFGLQVEIDEHGFYRTLVLKD